MRKKKISSPLLGRTIQKLAPRIGATVVIEPEWGVVGQITYPNGRRRYFKYSTVDINTVGAADIAKDKDYTNFFMRRMGYPVVHGKTFFSNDWSKAIGSGRTIDAGYRYAKRLGFPVIVKPNSGSQGKGVALVHTRKEFYRAMRHIFKYDRVALVQRPVHGKDYRIVVLDGKVISAYERIPLNITGDGTSTIYRLLKKKQAAFVASSRDTRIDVDDPRIEKKLSRQGYAVRSVLAKGARVFLLDNANLSTGGDSVDVTKKLHPDFRKLAVKLTKDMGLRLCGVDLMVRGDIREKPGVYWVLEVNAAPGLDHYATSGKKQKATVERMYLQVLRSMSR